MGLHFVIACTVHGCGDLDRVRGFGSGLPFVGEVELEDAPYSRTAVINSQKSGVFFSFLIT